MHGPDTTIRLHFEDVRYVLLLEAPQLLPSLEQRRSWLHILQETGWQVAGSRKRRAAAAAAAGDVLMHWVASDPEQDWRLQREVAAAEEAQRLAEQQAEMGLDGWDDYAEMMQGPGGYGMQSESSFVQSVEAVQQGMYMPKVGHVSAAKENA